MNMSYEKDALLMNNSKEKRLKKLSKIVDVVELFGKIKILTLNFTYRF